MACNVQKEHRPQLVSKLWICECNDTMIYYIEVYYTIPYHTIPYHTIPYYTILYYIILYYSPK